MTAIPTYKKTPIPGGFFNTRLQKDATAGRITLSKQLQPAETNQLYTISIKSRKLNRQRLYALVSFFNRTLRAVQTGLCDMGQIKFVQCGKSRRTQIMTVDSSAFK